MSWRAGLEILKIMQPEKPDHNTSRSGTSPPLISLNQAHEKYEL